MTSETPSTAFVIPKPAAIAVIALLGFLAYANTLDGEFVWDDASSILLHQHVKDPSTIGALFREDQHAFAGGQGNFYRPLLSVAFLVDYALARIGQPPLSPESIPEDLSPFLFHLSSILWHIAAASFLFLLMARVGAPAFVCGIVPIVYVLHPLHTEAVAYISGRADSMSAAFMFAGLYAATWRDTRRQFVTGTTLATACFAAALLSKESSLIFPVLLALYLVLLAPVSKAAAYANARRKFTPLVPSIVVLGIYIALRSTVLKFSSDTTPSDSGLVQRVVETLQSFALYGKLLIVPTGLHMERTLDAVPGYTSALGGLLLLTIIVLLVVALKSGQRRIAFALAWFVVTWLPISGLFPLNAPMAEHWMYVPMAGFFWGLGEGLYLVIGRVFGPSNILAPRAALVLITLWMLTLLVLTAQRNRDWRDNESLYVATLRENPHSVRVHFNLAVTYQDLLDNPTGARRHFEAVTRHYDERKKNHPDLQGQYWRDELEAHLSLGDLYHDDFRLQQAFSHYRFVMGVSPDGPNHLFVARAFFGAGRVYLESGDYAAARQHLAQAAALDPSLAAEAQRLLVDIAPLAQFTPPTGATASAP